MIDLPVNGRFIGSGAVAYEMLQILQFKKSVSVKCRIRIYSGS